MEAICGSFQFRLRALCCPFQPRRLVSPRGWICGPSRLPWLPRQTSHLPHRLQYWFLLRGSYAAARTLWAASGDKRRFGGGISIERRGLKHRSCAVAFRSALQVGEIHDPPRSLVHDERHAPANSGRSDDALNLSAGNVCEPLWCVRAQRQQGPQRAQRAGPRKLPSAA